ncbi:MAG: choice-of-anchor tandem repeat GloVer-containing protein, partial [Verrucomicrobiota bacterium]
FAINTDGSSFRTLHTFAALPSTSPPFTNDDGANPIGRLLLSGDTLYGTTSAGGTNDEGTVFAVSTNGTGFKDLYHFTALSSYPYTNSDGAGPQCGLIMLGNTLYGTAEYGGTNGYGTLFAINSNGTGFTILHTFSTGNDGGYPVADLISSSDILYGTTDYGGLALGTIYAIGTNGTDFKALYDFAVSDGFGSLAGLILSGGSLYGTLYSGGPNLYGSVYGLSLVPPLTISPSGTNVILSWPTNFSGFTLEFATNLNSTVWNAKLPAPFVVNTNNTVTNAISGTQKFYRLSQVVNLQSP